MVVTNTIEPEKNSLYYQLYMLLNTQRGTVPLFRDLGMDTRAVDKPITVIRAGIHAEIQSQIERYIPGLKLLSVDCSLEEGKLKIKCEVEEWQT